MDTVSLLEELAKDCLPPIDPGEVTVKMLADKMQVHRSTARDRLEQKVAAGELTWRWVRGERGIAEKAYRRVTPPLCP